MRIPSPRKLFGAVVGSLAYRLELLSRRVAKLAGWTSDAVPLPAAPATAAKRPADPARRFTVLRWQKKRYWTLYEGPDGAEARRRYEAVVLRQETGRMEFQMTDAAAPGGYVVRGVYGELDE